MFTLYQNIDMNVAEDPWLTKAPLKNGGGGVTSPACMGANVSLLTEEKQ